MSRVRLGDIVEILDWRRVPVSKSERSHREKRYPYYGAQGVVDYIDDYLFDGEYVLVAEDGNNLKTLKEPIVTWASGKFWVNNHAHILGGSDRASIRYIYYLLMNADMRGLITGSAQPKLNQENLASFEVKVPPLSEQRRIASVLSAIDDKIANNKRLMAELEATARLVYDYWFTQFDFPNEDGRPYRSSGGRMVWNDKLGREVPEGWKVDRLGNHIRTSRGVSYSSKNLADCGVAMVNLASFTPDGSYNPAGIKWFKGDYPASKVLEPYDLVICNTQQTSLNIKTDIIGKPLLIPDIFDGVILSSHHVTRVEADNELARYYLFALFRTPWFARYITGYASGTSILGIDNVGLERLLLPLPPNNVLKPFAHTTRILEEEKSLLIRERQQLASLRDWLLPMLMNGQVTVGE